MCSTSYAATFGHSRIVSALGQPLRIDVPVSQLTPDDLRSLDVSTAPASAWAQAGLTPPVDLESISLHLADGYTPGSKVIQLRSTQPFDKPVADLLLDVRTASGQQRHQVSLLTHASQDAIHAAGGVSQGPRAGATGSAAGQATDQRMLRGMIRVKKGDTMFAIARRHAVRGVTVYQMMMALQRANPQAFIQGNINLVKAGATLAMPDMAGLTAISDREARRLFAAQAQAFALYRQRLAASTSAVAKEGSASQGVVTAAGQSEPTQAAPAPEDQLRLSRGQASPAASASGISGASGGSGTAAGGSAAPGSAGSAGGSNDADVRADDSVAARKEIDESKERVSQLEQNVKHLNEALQSQGGAATDLIVDGAKGLSQSLADVANAVTSPGGTGAAPGSNGGATESGGTASVQGQESRNASSPAGSTASGDRPAAGGTPGAASTQGNAASSGSAASGGAATSGSTAGGSATKGSSAGGASAHGAAAGGTAASGSAGSGSAASGSVGSGSAASGSAANKAEASGSTASGSNASTASGASVSEPAATPSAANGGKPDAASTGSSDTGTSAAGGQAGDGTLAAGVPANGTPGGNAALAPSANGSAAAPGSNAATGDAATGNAATGSTAAGNTTAGSTAAGNADGNAAGSASKAGTGSSTTSSSTAPAAGLASAAPGAGSGTGTSEGAPNRADQTKPSSGTDRAGDVSEPISTRAEQTVSWIQEHMLGVITGLLALIVLVIAWLLRRANSGRDDGRGDNSGLITEAMVREKLDQINLDLSQSSADDAPSRRR